MSDNLPAWLVFLIALFGGGSIAAMGSVVVAWLRNRQIAETEERSIALTEVEKAIPGLSQVIAQLREQNMAQAGEIAQLREQNQSQAHDLSRISDRNQMLVGQVFNLENRVTELEHELAEARGHT